MSLYFPITSAPNPPWSWETEDNVLRSTTDAGFVISRPRYTTARDTFDVTWDLTDTEAETVQNFYKNDTAFGSFEFILELRTPNLRLNKTVQFTKPPSNSYQGLGTFQTKCTFREV